jgi:hypothetical protein
VATENFAAQTVDRRDDLVDERRQDTEPGEHGSQMAGDEVHVVIADPQATVGMREAATIVGPSPAEGDGEEGLLVGTLAAQVHVIEERRNFRVSEQTIVELVDGDIDAHHAAEPLEPRRDVWLGQGHDEEVACSAQGCHEQSLLKSHRARWARRTQSFGVAESAARAAAGAKTVPPRTTENGVRM